MKKTPHAQKKSSPKIFSILTPYKGFVILLIILSVGMNTIALIIPKLISHAIDSFLLGTFSLQTILLTFTAVAGTIFILTYIQGVIQTITSEKVARDIRNDITQKISEQTFLFVQKATPAKLLTNLTSDIDAIKLFVSQAIVSIISSLITIVGSAVLLLTIDWKLALAVLSVLPIIAITFSLTLAKVRILFKDSQGVIDWLNRVINESILGSALIRVLNAQQSEYDKFIAANSKAKDIGMNILRLFAGLIPTISFVASIAMLIILVLGGHFVINQNMSLGDFAAFNSYVSLMIFPIFVIGFMSNVIARATASYERILSILSEPVPKKSGSETSTISGDIKLEHVRLTYGEHSVLSDVTFSIKAGSKNAIIGPTAAGKTQLLYALTGLIQPQHGDILFDRKPIHTYDPEHLHAHMGFVFQDSIMFNVSVKENIAFSPHCNDEDLKKALAVAELHDFIASLPQGIDTIISERGTTLSGGQKQRIMLARALALNPSILLLDDFTARVDVNTEKRIIQNIQKNYPNITLVSVTQKIASIENYDQIILLMEGEVLATGTHASLMSTCPEYVQIYNSQQSTQTYELPTHE